VAGLFLREQFLIERSENFQRAHVGDGDVAGIIRASVSEGDQASVREGKSAAAASAGCGRKVIGDFLDNALDGIETDFGVALIVVTEKRRRCYQEPIAGPAHRGRVYRRESANWSRRGS